MKIAFLNVLVFLVAWSHSVQAQKPDLTIKISIHERTDVIECSNAVLRRLPASTMAKKEMPSDFYHEFVQAKKELEKMSKGKNLSDHEFLKLYKSMEKRSDNISRLAIKYGGANSCPGGCNDERLECKEKCKQNGKVICGCLATAIGCGVCCGLGCPSK